MINKLFPVIFYIAPFLLLVGCASDEVSKDNVAQIIRSGSRPIQAEEKSDDYVIRPLDEIKLDVWGYPEFNTETIVKELGTVTIPHIGEVTAAGLTKDQFNQRLIIQLAEYIQGEVKLSLMVVSSIPQKITVLGAVNAQENYPLTSEVTLLEAISMARGLGPDADLRTIKILRGGLHSKPIVVDLTYFLEEGNIESIPIVRPGDTIYVPADENVIRDLSAFMRDVIFMFGFFQLFD